MENLFSITELSYCFKKVSVSLYYLCHLYTLCIQCVQLDLIRWVFLLAAQLMEIRFYLYSKVNKEIWNILIYLEKMHCTLGITIYVNSRILYLNYNYDFIVYWIKESCSSYVYKCMFEMFIRKYRWMAKD